MTPFTESTAAAAGSRGGRRRTMAQRAALQMGRQARAGSGYVPQDPEAVRAVLEAVRERAASARRGGHPPDPHSLRSAAQAIGSGESSLRAWISGRSWPRPESVAALRRWLAGAR